MHDEAEAKRIATTNAERQALATASGWQFRADGGDLVGRWNVKPFREVGDMRAVYGVVYGMVGPVNFTAFDYLRREKVTQALGVPVNIFVIETIWVLQMPAALPPFQIVDSAEPSYDMTGGFAPVTADKKVNRGSLLFDTDPTFASTLLSPQVTSVMRDAKLNNWAIAGQDLVCSKYPIFGRVKPPELAETAAALHRLMSAFPPHLWNQPPQSQPRFQQQTHTPVATVHWPPPQPAAQQQQPSYQQPGQAQPGSHQPSPQHPGYPAQPGYQRPAQVPQPGYQQPGHPPGQHHHGAPAPVYPQQQGYPQQVYPQQGHPPR